MVQRGVVVLDDGIDGHRQKKSNLETVHDARALHVTVPQQYGMPVSRQRSEGPLIDSRKIDRSAVGRKKPFRNDEIEIQGRGPNVRRGDAQRLRARRRIVRKCETLHDTATRGDDQREAGEQILVACAGQVLKLNVLYSPAWSEKRLVMR